MTKPLLSFSPAAAELKDGARQFEAFTRGQAETVAASLVALGSAASALTSLLCQYRELVIEILTPVAGDIDALPACQREFLRQTVQVVLGLGVLLTETGEGLAGVGGSIKALAGLAVTPDILREAAESVSSPGLQTMLAGYHGSLGRLLAVLEAEAAIAAPTVGTA